MSPGLHSAVHCQSQLMMAALLFRFKCELIDLCCILAQASKLGHRACFLRRKDKAVTRLQVVTCWGLSRIHVMTYIEGSHIFNLPYVFPLWHVLKDATSSSCDMHTRLSHVFKLWYVLGQLRFCAVILHWRLLHLKIVMCWVRHNCIQGCLVLELWHVLRLSRLQSCLQNVTSIRVAPSSSCDMHWGLSRLQNVISINLRIVMSSSCNLN